MVKKQRKYYITQLQSNVDVTDKGLEYQIKESENKRCLKTISWLLLKMEIQTVALTLQLILTATTRQHI